MISMDMYKSMLSSKGTTLGGIHKAQSNDIINATFTSDPTYKQVRVLTRTGWHLYDAKYQFHSSQTISKDTVDQYLQFRPGVEFPIGTYVIVPDDNDISTETYEDQVEWFKIANRDKHIGVGNKPQLWFIVSRNDANAYVRYSIIQVNWNFQWIYDGVIQHCLGAMRMANSYTSGVWVADYSTALDNLTAAWMPDTHAVYGDDLNGFGLCDTRTITHGNRFMLTNNVLNPEVYSVTKVLDMAPQGLIKLSLKQDEYDYTCDNKDLLICNYYNRTGNVEPNEPSHNEDDLHGMIIPLLPDENGELYGGEYQDMIDMSIGSEYFFGIKDWKSDSNPNWKITLDPSSKDDQSKSSYHEDSYYEHLMKITQMDNVAISIKPGKARSLIGKKFKLCIYDADGNSHSVVGLEVSGYAT